MKKNLEDWNGSVEHCKFAVPICSADFINILLYLLYNTEVIMSGKVWGSQCEAKYFTKNRIMLATHTYYLWTQLYLLIS